MMIKNLGARVESVWQGLRPITQKMLVGVMQSASVNSNQGTKFQFDTHADWELSRLLNALDERLTDSKTKLSKKKFQEISQFAETCANVLQAQTESAEVFIQLAERALKEKDYSKIDVLANGLNSRFSVGEVCEIIRQSTNPAIVALGYEALALVSPASLIPCIEDPIYAEIALLSLKQQAYEFESEEARDILEDFDPNSFGIESF